MSGTRRHREFQDWSETGDFLKKPKGGWLHTSDQLNPHAGVCYSATYLGYIDVLESLMGHNCAMRARAVKESVERLADETKIHPKMRRRTNDTCGILGKMFAENTDVKFILKYNTLDTLALQTDKKLASHDISEISYVSGEETIPGELEFVSYVAKHNDHRACYVFECGGDLAHDIIATIAQTIEIRYKMLLADQGIIPRPKFTTKIYDVFHICSSKAVRHQAFFAKKGIMFEKKLTKKDQEKMEEKLLSLSFGGGGGSVYDNNTAPVEPEYDFYDNAKGNPDPDPYSYDDAKSGVQDDSHSVKSREKKKAQVLLLDDPYGDYDNAMHRATQLEYGSANDSIYMKEEIPSHTESRGKVLSTAPVGQVWFHGKISRQRCEELLHEEGQFIVRESTTAPGQYVLSSYTAGRIRHLILVDQTGVVRANGHVYPSVEELVDVHMNGGPAISSAGLQIVLKEPIGVSEEKC